MRHAILVGVCLSSALVAQDHTDLRAGAKAAPGKLKIYAQAAWNRPAPDRNLVLRSPAELAKAFPPIGDGLDRPAAEKKRAEMEVAEALNVDIDWKKHMLVVLHLGKASVVGEQLKLTRLDVTDGKLTVFGEHIAPGAERPDEAGRYLTLVALVDRFDGPVNFRIEFVALK